MPQPRESEKDLVKDLHRLKDKLVAEGKVLPGDAVHKEPYPESLRTDLPKKD